LEFVNILHQLLVHLDLLHGYLPGVGQVVPHVVVFLVLDGSLECRDHLALALDELHLLLDSVQMRVVDVLLCSHSLLLESLRVHHTIGAHFQVAFIVLLHDVIILSVIAGAWVHWHLLSSHKRSRRRMKLLRHLLLIKLLVCLLSLPGLGRATADLLLRHVLCVAASHGLCQGGRHLA